MYTENIPESNSLMDSSMSSVEINPVHGLNWGKNIIITNTIYSLQTINYKNERCSFICKSIIEEPGSKDLESHMRSEKINFLDYDLKKFFEIEAEQRRIELKEDYYITHGLFTDFPRTFELNNYETGEEFAHCRGSCLVVKVPNTKTVTHFGFQPLNFSIDTSMQIVGSITFSINHELEQELFIWRNPPAIYHSIVNIRFEPKNEMDKISHTRDVGFRELTLVSKNKQEGKEQISGFDIVLSFKKENPLGSRNWEKVEHTISIINGKITGANVIETDGELDMTLD